jgi:hypothetical protein
MGTTRHERSSQWGPDGDHTSRAVADDLRWSERDAPPFEPA